jgi:hypothetical protein
MTEKGKHHEKKNPGRIRAYILPEFEIAEYLIRKLICDEIIT